MKMILRADQDPCKDVAVLRLYIRIHTSRKQRQQINALIPNEKVNTDYLYYALKYRSPYLPALAGRAAIPIVNKSNFGKFLVPLPPLPEQKAIAHTLQTIQKAKVTRQRELELERERKAALMQHLFTHGTRNEPRKQTEIGEIPESWEIVPFKSITVSGTQNGIYKSKEFYGRGYQLEFRLMHDKMTQQY